MSRFLSPALSAVTPYTPGEQNIRKGPADYTGRICVIGSQLKEDKLSQLFGL